MPFPFSPPTLLAPLWGALPAQLQAQLAGYGRVGLVCTPFVRITSHSPVPGHMRRHVERAAVRPICVQILGSDTRQMARAASLLSEAGADVVDINLGCPVHNVVRKGAGAALLRDPEKLGQLLGEVRKATSCLLSAKLRAGYQTRGTALELAKIAEDAGLDFITLHPRSREDMYGRAADWNLVADAKRELTIPVVGNGDVWYAADALRLQRQTGCDAVMIGRPVLRNPWIFRQIEQLRHGQATFVPTGADVVQHLHRTAETIVRTVGGSRRGPLAPFKEHLSWILRAVRGQRDLLDRALRTTALHSLLELLDHELGCLPAEALDLDAHGRQRLEAAVELDAGQTVL